MSYQAKIEPLCVARTSLIKENLFLSRLGNSLKLGDLIKLRNMIRLEILFELGIVDT